MASTATSYATPFLAFASDAQDAETIKQFAAKHGWADSCVKQGDIKSATEFLKNNPSPTLLLVEITSAGEAKAQLDGLAEVCSPDTKVIVIGTVNEYSFFCWLMDIGISSYLLKPMTEQVLDGAYVKSVTRTAVQSTSAKQLGKIIALVGARGGVGSTTLAINLAGVIAESSKKNTALVDLDPTDGSIALSLDLEPSRGFREALEKPDRIDPLFIDRVMHKQGKYLSVLSSEESLYEPMAADDSAADILMKELRDRFQVIILDLPRHLDGFSQKCLSQAEQVVLVAELTLSSLRDTLRLSDALRDMFKLKPPLVVVNRVGMAAKQAVTPADFEKGVGAKIAYSIPFAPDVFMQIGNEIPAVKARSNAAVKPLLQLAAQLVPEAKMQVAEAKEEEKAKGGGLFKRAAKPETKA